jgi:protein-S-isoprenylcysteine O-methyltransferase Ste14
MWWHTMPLMMPIGWLQFWTFTGCGLTFFVLLLRNLSRRAPESGGRSDRRSQLGIAIQSIGIGLVGLGPIKPTLASLGLIGLAGTAAVLLLMGGAIGLFTASSRELGRNWSLVARTRGDHELVRTGPYSRVRHPIYLGLLLFMLALAVALGHWAQLLIALPVFFAGTEIRTRIEDSLLEQSFGDAFRDYRNATPAILPRLF